MYGGGTIYLSDSSFCSNRLVRYSIPDSAVILDAEITAVYGNADAIVTIISDDGYYESGCNFNDLLCKHNLKGTIAGAVKILKPNYINWKKLINVGNVEIVNHSYDHVRMEKGSRYSFSYLILHHEIVDADKYIEELTDTKQICFVCPENQMCTKGYKVLGDNGFYAVRRGSRNFNSLSPDEGTEQGQWFNLCCMGVMDEGVNTEIRNNWVDYAVENKVWLIEMWHNVMYEDDGFYQTILVPDADEHLSYIEKMSSDKSIWVATFTEATKYIREKQNAKLYSYIIDDEIHIYVELTDRNMTYDTFNQPLTVKVLLPIRNDIVYYNVVPGKEMIIKLDG